MNMYDIITKKKRGSALTRAEIAYWVGGYVAGEIPDYQVSALLMAICLRGMTIAETTDFTEIMAASGDRIDLSAIADHKIDKHSTGGVGDKTTLIVSPIVAACGCKAPKMSEILPTPITSYCARLSASSIVSPVGSREKS